MLSTKQQCPNMLCTTTSSINMVPIVALDAALTNEHRLEHGHLLLNPAHVEASPCFCVPALAPAQQLQVLLGIYGFKGLRV